MAKVALSAMKNNQKGRVVEVLSGHALQHRLLGMGISPGRELTKLSQFMLKGPLAVKVGRSVVALGFGTASKIIVETNG